MVSMNELTIIANEVHEQAVADFKVSERFAYSFIMKVRRIRDERLYKELGYGSFDDYCEVAWNIHRDFMDQRIQIAESFGEQNFADTYRQLGHSKSLILARMEPDVRKQIQENHNVDEMTVRKLRDTERQLKEKEELLESTKASAEHWQKVARAAQNMPPRVETKTIEVVPEHVKREIQSKENQISNLQNSMEVMKKRLELMESMQKSYEKDSKEYQELKKQIGFLNREKDDIQRQIESATALSGLAVEIDNFLKTKLAPIRYSRVFERFDSEVAVKNFTDILNNVRAWLEDMERYVPKNNRKVVEVFDYDPAS
jgi:hypothetical protein